MTDNVVSFAVAQRQHEAQELNSVADKLSSQLRSALLLKLELIQDTNLREADWKACLEAIQGAAAIKEVIAETYQDVQIRLAELAHELGRPVSQADVNRVARALHPECFQVRLR
jgi:conjugal transfer/entry exclusion protein